MVTTKTYLEKSRANEAIGGVPTLHYFNFQSKGRGQVIRLLFEDADIQYEDVRYDFDEYPKFKMGKLQEYNPLGTIPVVELNGRILIQSYAMLRHFARQMGAYDGKTEEEKYWADAMCDAAIDWRSKFVDAFVTKERATTYPKHCKEVRPTFLHGLNQQLSSHSSSVSGPFVIGNTITYADLVIYQICHDEQLIQNGREGLKEYPRLAKLIDAVEMRPNVQRFLKSERYLG
ncbi:MAG: hypothetical protein M1828_001517 [Chrysothrix sp. TS-e1954]|nr:MAG: hypothetical protein M1828_001517 [Chrysothrix sp. TS-e1954]